MNISVPVSEPSAWFLAFFETTSLGWLNRAPLLRFRHVSAFGYAPGFNCWIFYDVHWRGVSIYLVSHETAKARIGELTRGAIVVRMARREDALPLHARLGFYCVPAMKHLVGLACVAVTPDGFYRSVLKAGGEVVFGCESAAAAAGPDAAASGAASPD